MIRTKEVLSKAMDWVAVAVCAWMALVAAGFVMGAVWMFLRMGFVVAVRMFG